VAIAISANCDGVGCGTPPQSANSMTPAVPMSLHRESTTKKLGTNETPGAAPIPHSATRSVSAVV
jgi:hypothetical protein